MGLCWIFLAPCISLIFSHVRERNGALLRSVVVGGVWNGFLLGRVRGQAVPCLFCGAPDGDGHLFWECTFPPLVEIRESPEFHDLIIMDKGHWPRCLLWHGWLLMLSGVNGASPWAANAADCAGYLVESSLGRYSSSMVAEWSPSVELDGARAASSMPDHPNVWTDGSLVLDRVTGVSSSGAGFFAQQSENCWSGRRWDHFDGVRPGGEVSSCRGPLQSVQRAEMWGVILALQSSHAVHLGVDNLWVVRHVGLLLDGKNGSSPFELVMVTFSCLFKGCFIFGVWTRFGLLRLKGMLMKLWFLTVGLVMMVGCVTMLLMRLLTLVVGGLVMLSLMRVVVCLGFVVAGILHCHFSCCCQS